MVGRGLTFSWNVEPWIIHWLHRAAAMAPAPCYTVQRNKYCPRCTWCSWTASRQRSALTECLSVDVGVTAAEDKSRDGEKLNKVRGRGSGILWGLEDQIFREWEVSAILQTRGQNKPCGDTLFCRWIAFATAMAIKKDFLARAQI